MKTNFFTAIFFALSLFYACTSKQDEQQGYGRGSGDGVNALEEPPPLEEEKEKFSPADIKADEEVPDEGSYNESLKTTPQQSVKKIIKDGSISIKTNDINTSKKGIDELLKKLNAYYEKEDLQNNDQIISYELKIRVSADNFEKLISSIENGKDEIKSKNIQARDVTEEYVDIEARLTNKREFLKRYKDLLSKASTVKTFWQLKKILEIFKRKLKAKRVG